MPILVLNDEGHHCWRPARRSQTPRATGEEEKALEGRDRGGHRLGRRAGQAQQRQLPRPAAASRFCVDLSATPFYIKGSGHLEGRPFPWLVSDFGLVDAIESGIVKIPRLPVQDTTGRPDPAYFQLWEAHHATGPAAGRAAARPGAEAQARGGLPRGRGRAAPARRPVGGALPLHPGGHARPGQDPAGADHRLRQHRHRRGLLPQDQRRGAARGGHRGGRRGGRRTARPRHAEAQARQEAEADTVYGKGEIFPELFSNTADREAHDPHRHQAAGRGRERRPGQAPQDAAEELRQVVATVGKPGQPGEQVRCVVSVSMLTEGWDANNVTHILGIRAFGSQLLCEQVVGPRPAADGLHAGPEDRALLTEEYVDVYGIPFSLIPFKGRPTKKPEPEDKPKNHVRALPERAGYGDALPRGRGLRLRAAPRT